MTYKNLKGHREERSDLRLKQYYLTMTKIASFLAMTLSLLPPTYMQV